MRPLDFHAGHPSPSAPNLSRLHFCLLMGSGKHISLQGAPLDAAAYCCGPAGSAPLCYASQWEHHRKVSVRRLWHLQSEGGETLSFCFSAFPDTAHCQGHEPTLGDLQWSIIYNAVVHVKKRFERVAPLEKIFFMLSNISSVDSHKTPSQGQCSQAQLSVNTMHERSVSFTVSTYL